MSVEGRDTQLEFATPLLLPLAVQSRQGDFVFVSVDPSPV